MVQQSQPIRRCLLVARDYAHGTLNPHLEAIATISERHEVDTISFALSTLERSRRGMKPERLLQSAKHLRYALLESYLPAKHESEIDQRFHLVSSGGTRDFTRHFASSFEPAIADKKAKLLAELPQRAFANALILICGEISMLRVSHKDHRTIEDPYSFRDRLKPRQVVFAPAHSFMRRHEQARKRRAISLHGRTVISVWNKNSHVGREPALPWSIYRNGEDISGRVKPVAHTIKNRPDIQMGLLDL